MNPIQHSQRGGDLSIRIGESWKNDNLGTLLLLLHSRNIPVSIPKSMLDFAASCFVNGLELFSFFWGRCVTAEMNTFLLVVVMKRKLIQVRY